MLHVEVFVFNPFQENTYVVSDETKAAVVIDPGCYEKEEKQALTDYIREHDLRVVKLLNTHCHIDHVLGNAFVKDEYNTRLYLHRMDEPVLRAVSAYASNYGFQQYQPATPDVYIEEGEEIEVGNQSLKVLFVPGHSPGHVAFYHEGEKVLLGGDVLFRNSVGRTDLPGGNTDTLLESIHEKLFTLPDDVTVYPGHGPTTTIGFEKTTNPFCALTR
jgi:glyoxylase-like metal-dependent hydrolase (beta-lactamase superfamily II)